MILPDHVSDPKSLQSPALPCQCYRAMCPLVSADSLSLRNLEEMTAERGIVVDHPSIAGLSASYSCWIRHFVDVNVPWGVGGEWKKPI